MDRLSPILGIILLSSLTARAHDPLEQGAVPHMRAANTTSASVAYTGDSTVTTTRPSSATAMAKASSDVWRYTVQTLAVHLSDEATIASLVEAGARLRALDPSADASPAALAAAAASSLLVGTYAYDGVPATLASDLAADLQNAAGIPAEQRQRMIPVSAGALERADATAAAWIAEVLGLTAEAAAPQRTPPVLPALPVGVIVLWNPSLGEAGHPPCQFVLLRGGSRPDAAGRIGIADIAFGNPLTSTAASTATAGTSAAPAARR